MNSIFRYILIISGVVLLGITLWYFSHIVAYILVSAVLSFVGRPIVDLLGKIEIKGRNMPKSLRAFSALLLMWGVFIIFLTQLIPLVVSELNYFSAIRPENVINSLQGPINWLETTIDRFSSDRGEVFTVQEFISDKLISVFNVTFLGNFFSNMASALGNLFIALFSVTFITFFFLRDENLFAESLLALVPDKHTDSFRHAMLSTRKLLVRYFIGILLQTTGIFTMVTIGLTIAGVGFSHSILIGLLAGILNVIPYLGPLMGAVLGVILSIATHLDLDFTTQLLPLTGWVVVVFSITQLTDNFIFQPFIFSSSVKAHPLEIFLVILIAGSLAGIPGMILAIPGYTVLRVFAKEFLNNFKVVKKLTSKI
ncbi:MAG: AI-2E family transporter [Bacteroidales bacterium]|nr:AI-2E family transporter [Bacteroidales bacterium]